MKQSLESLQNNSNSYLLNERETIFSEDKNNTVTETTITQQHEEMIVAADTQQISINIDNCPQSDKEVKEDAQCDSTVVKGQGNQCQGNRLEEYSLPVDNLPQHHPMHMRIIKSRKGSVRKPTYDSVIDKRLEIDSQEQSDDEIVMGVVSAATEHKPKRRSTRSRLDYDDVIVNPIPRTASEVFRKNRNLGEL